MEYRHLLVDREGHIGRLTLNRPERLNALNFRIGVELLDALDENDRDPEVRVVILTGAGRAFCAGDDLRGMSVPGEPDRRYADPLKQYVEGEGRWPLIVARLRALSKPVIAMVNGDALGIGTSVALHCDLIIAREDAVITDLHIALDRFTPGLPPTGVVPGDGGTVILPLQMGLAKAKEFLFLGKPVTAKQLAQMNAINAAVPAAELESVVEGYVKDLLERPAWALAWTKVAVNKRLKQHLTLYQDVAMALEALSMRAAQAKLEGGKGISHL